MQRTVMSALLSKDRRAIIMKYIIYTYIYYFVPFSLPRLRGVYNNGKWIDLGSNERGSAGAHSLFAPEWNLCVCADDMESGRNIRSPFW